MAEEPGAACADREPFGGYLSERSSLVGLPHLRGGVENTGERDDW